MLTVDSLGVMVGKATLLQDVSFTLSEGDVLMVVGPNGSGKTTMVRALMNALPHTGSASFMGKPMAGMPADELARCVGVLTQSNAMQFSYEAQDVVALGRYAHKQGFIGGLRSDDRAAIERAMALTRTDGLRGRSVTTLSGGELQRVCLARVLAQDPRVLVLDEPTNHLDIEHQINLFDIIATWAKEPGRAVLAIVHDLNLAYTYGTHALLLHEGRRVAFGPPGEVLTRELLQSVYHVDLVEWMRGLLSRWK